MKVDKKSCNFNDQVFIIIIGAKDLIAKLLRRKPKDRLPLVQVMEHPWIVQNSKPPGKPSNSARAQTTSQQTSSGR